MVPRRSRESQKSPKMPSNALSGWNDIKRRPSPGAKDAPIVSWLARVPNVMLNSIWRKQWSIWTRGIQVQRRGSTRRSLNWLSSSTPSILFLWVFLLSVILPTGDGSGFVSSRPKGSNQPIGMTIYTYSALRHFSLTLRQLSPHPMSVHPDRCDSIVSALRILPRFQSFAKSHPEIA